MKRNSKRRAGDAGEGTKTAAIAEALAAKRRRLADTQQTSVDLARQFEHAERAFGAASANDRTAEIAQREAELDALATRQRRTLLTNEALEAEIAELVRQLEQADADERAGQVRALITRVEHAAIKADKFFGENGPARQALAEFLDIADELGIAVGGNRPSDIVGRGVAAHLMDLAPNQFRHLCHTPGAGSHDEQTGYPACFLWWAKRLGAHAVSATRPFAIVADVQEPTGTED